MAKYQLANLALNLPLILPKPLTMFLSLQSGSGYFSANLSPLIGKELSYVLHTVGQKQYFCVQKTVGRPMALLSQHIHSPTTCTTSTGTTLAHATLRCPQDSCSGLCTGLPLPLLSHSVFPHHSSQVAC